MTSSPLSVVVRQLRTAAERDGEGKTDAELLTRFLSHRDGDALAALVRRHAPMVWGVCRRTLHNPHDAEDAFQATFLVLVRKAATVRPREMLANWLYGVARQTAVRSRATAARRGGREMQMEQLPEPVTVEVGANELLPLLDQELVHLPQRFQALIVLCDLEGKTRKEAARQLGCPEGTVASRLARARELLAKRLARRGLAVSGASLAAALSQTTASADVPIAVLNSTINIATQLATGQSADMISAPVAALTEGTLKAMLITKLKAVYTVVLALGFLAAGTTGLVYRQATAQDIKPPVAEERVTPPPRQEPEKEPFTAWGKEFGGLQAGLGFHSGEKRAYHHGEMVTLVVRVRNVGKEEVKFQHIRAFFVETAPHVMDAADKGFTMIPFPAAEGEQVPSKTALASGKEMELYELKLKLRPDDDDKKIPGLRPYDTVESGSLWGLGKVRLEYGRLALPDIDPILSKLATGKLELEIKAEPPPSKPEPAKESDKEVPAVWGKELNGLQAGLAQVPADTRTYRPGEKVKLEVRLRNVGKAAITIIYDFPQESAPEITDGEGRQVYVTMPPIFLGVRENTTRRILRPGENMTLYKPKVAVEARLPENRNAAEPIVDVPTIRVGPGKYKIAIGGMVQSHPTLATGAVEFETKDALPAAGEETAWGKEFGGLQAGLGFHPGEKRAYSHGETAKLVLWVRNVGKEEAKFQYLRQFFIELPPAVTDDAGKPVTLPGVTTFGIHIPKEVTLAPGKEIELYELDLELRPSGENDGRRPATLYGTGKFGLQYERVIGNSSSGQIKPDPLLGKLATGKLELEVFPKETVTAWGKEAGGLQAGLGFHPGGKRVYGSGETIKLVLRVRNVGKEEAKFEYVYAFFVENPPEVTDDAGKKVPLVRLEAGGLHAPKEAKLAPGKEIELYELELQLKPAAKVGDIDLTALKTTRKYQIQYERLTGPTSAGPRKPDPLLEKLSTGRLEVEVKTEPPADTGKTPPKNESGKADPFAPPEAPPTQMEMRLAATVKQFLVTMRNHHGDKNANALREFIDPRYLKMHDLTDRDLSVPMPAVGSIINFETAGDGQTILCIVDVEAAPPKKIREALLLRVSVHEGKPYIAPQKAPDPKTGAFTPWILRTRTDYP